MRLQTPHGPDEHAFLGASRAVLEPTYFQGGLAFMFETCYMLKLAPEALHADSEPHKVSRHPTVQSDYVGCWKKLPKLFDGTSSPPFPSAPNSTKTVVESVAGGGKKEGDAI